MTDKQTEYIKMLQAERRQLREALGLMLAAYEAVLPGIKFIAVQDYALINEAPIAARLALKETA